MSTDNLVLMANRIGEFFESLPDRGEARAGVAEHLRKFWAPGMRRALLLRLGGDDPGLSALVLESLQTHRAELWPQDASAGAAGDMFRGADSGGGC